MQINTSKTSTAKHTNQGKRSTKSAEQSQTGPSINHQRSQGHSIFFTNPFPKTRKQEKTQRIWKFTRANSSFNGTVNKG